MTTIVAPPWEEQPTEGGIADAPSDAVCTVMDATGCRVYMPGDYIPVEGE